MGCSLHKASVNPGIEWDVEVRWLGFSDSDLDAVRLLCQRAGERNAGAFTLQALAAFSGVTAPPFALRLFRVSATTEVLDLRRFLTGLW